MRSRGSLIANISWLGVAEIVSRGFGFIATIILARRLGTAAFGDYVVASAVAGYALIIAVPGGETLGVRMHRQQANDQNLFAALFQTRLLGSVGACVLLLVCAVVLPLRQLQQDLLLLHVLLLPGLILNVSFVMQAEERMTVPAFGRVVQSALYVAGVAVVIWGADDVQYVPIVLSVAMLAHALVSMVAARRLTGTGAGLIQRVHVGRLLEVIRSATPIMLSSLLIAVYYSMDSIMLGLMRSSDEAGMYGASYRIVLFLVGGGALLYQGLMPRLADADIEVRMRAHRNLVRIMSWSGLLGGGILIVFSELILIGLYGDACLPATTALMILGGVVMLVFVNVALASPMQLWGQEKRHMKIVGAAACVNLVLNMLLIPEWGMEGAAWATVAAELVVLVLALLSHRVVPGATIIGGRHGEV